MSAISWKEGEYDFHLEVDPAQLEEITKRLDGLVHKSPTVLKNASNETTRKSIKMTSEEIDKRYMYEGHGGESDNLQKHLKRKVATYANPRNIVDVSDFKKEIIDFDVSHKRPLSRSNPASWVQGHLHMASARKHLRHPDSGNKGFVVQFKTGHVSVVGRVPGKDKDGKFSKRKIKTIMGLSYAHMASQGFKQIEDEVGAMLQANVDKQIRKVMDRING